MIKNIFQTFFTKIGTALLNLITIVCVSRYLGAEGKGVSSLIITTVSFILVATNVYAGTSLVYFTSRENNGSLIVTAYGWSFLVVMFSGCILAQVALVPHEFLIPILCISLLQSLYYVHLKWLMGKEKVKAANGANVVQSLSMLLAFMGLMWFQTVRMDHYIYSLYISFGLAYFLTLLWSLTFWTKPDWSGIVSFWRKISAYGWLNQADNVLFLLTIRVNFYLLEYYAGPSALGIYSNAVALAEAVWLLTYSVSIVLYARISNQSDDQAAQKATLILAKICAAASFVGVGCLSLIPNDLYLWIFGKSFPGIQQIILIFWPGVTLFSAGLVITQYYSGTGKFKWNAVFSLIGFSLVCLIGFWTIPIYGILGAATAASVAYGITGSIIIYVFTNQSSVLTFKEWVLWHRWSSIRLLLRFENQ